MRLLGCELGSLCLQGRYFTNWTISLSLAPVPNLFSSSLLSSTSSLYRQILCFKYFSPVPLWPLGCPSLLGRSQCLWLCQVQILALCLFQSWTLPFPSPANHPHLFLAHMGEIALAWVPWSALMVHTCLLLPPSRLPQAWAVLKLLLKFPDPNQ